MLKEALEYMAETGKKSASRIIKADHEPGHIYYIRNTDDTLTKVTAEPSPRGHTAADLQAIAEMASLNKSIAEIWYSRLGFTLLLGVGRRDRVQLPLQLSEPLKLLSQWEASKPSLRQDQLIKALRITFRDCLAPAGNLVEIIRRIKFGTASNGESTIEHGKQSIGKSLTAEITGTSILPEYFTLSVPIFSHSAFVSAQYAIECALEPDPQTASFQVIPLPGRVEKAVAQGESRLGVMLGEALGGAEASDVPVFFGAA